MKSLARQISENYDMGTVVSYDLIHDGIDNQIYKLSFGSKHKKLVARVGKRNERYKNFDFEVELLRYLTDDNVSIPKLIATKKRKDSIDIDGARVALFEYIDGDVFYSVNEELLCKDYVKMGGRLLGELHMSTVSFKPEHKPKRTIFTEIERLKRCAEDDLKRFEGYQKFVAHVNTFAKEAQERIHTDLSNGIIHNDYHIGNLIYAKNRSRAYMIDFDWACEGPFFKDLGFAIGAWSCGDIRKELPDMRRISAFLAGYNDAAPHKVNYDSSLLFWVCFAYISEACTFFLNVLDGCYSDLNITKVEQCLSYRKFLYFFNQYV